MYYDMNDDYAEERASNRRRYNCGGAAAYDGPCGAPDCSSCRNGSDPDDVELEGALARADEAGYTVDVEDGSAMKTISTKIRTARRDHKSGAIMKGDRYRETVRRTIFEDGSSSLRRIAVRLQAVK
ncbi:hypothetical protein UFOVP1382_133 [uncultured Caudovirales phage]|uniref:Uncharacterized protein n=1 Tax=uncultured Caudovirales phage TaxID=2100421 RepID=A0A6J5S3W7_9CAUD|nr:hypothetical protein UFOVP1382_133 [uncultured Caudovirales phage]